MAVVTRIEDSPEPVSDTEIVYLASINPLYWPAGGVKSDGDGCTTQLFSVCASAPKTLSAVTLFSNCANVCSAGPPFLPTAGISHSTSRPLALEPSMSDPSGLYGCPS